MNAKISKLVIRRDNNINKIFSRLQEKYDIEILSYETDGKINPNLKCKTSFGNISIKICWNYAIINFSNKIKYENGIFVSRKKLFTEKIKFISSKLQFMSSMYCVDLKTKLSDQKLSVNIKLEMPYNSNFQDTVIVKVNLPKTNVAIGDGKLSVLPDDFKIEIKGDKVTYNTAREWERLCLRENECSELKRNADFKCFGDVTEMLMY